MKFIRPNKRILKNAQHYAFIDAFLRVVKAAGFVHAKITALIAALTTAFANEDRWYMVAHASDIVKQREEADRQRDSAYQGMKSLITTWAVSDEPQKGPAARALKKIIDLYKLNVKAQIDEETGVMDNMIADLKTTERQTYLTTINATYFFNQMVAANEQVKTLRIEQGKEESEKVKGALAAARDECDKLYDELTYLIEAGVLMSDDATPYEAFIKEWNGDLKIYQDMLDRKAGKTSGSSSSSAGDNTGGDSSQTGGDDNTGGESGGDSGTGGGSGSGDGGDDSGSGGSGSGDGGDDSGSGGSGSGDGGDDSGGGGNVLG